MAEILIEVEVNRLRPNPYQVRILDETDPALLELKDSISKFGLIEPIIVRSTADGWWEIAAGHRRWQCHVLLVIPKIKCIQRDLTDEQMCEAILDENLRRQSFNPIDEAKAYRNLKDKFAWTEERTATRFHVSRDKVAQRIRLLSFQQPIQDLVAKGHLGVSHAEAIATAPASKQLELAKTVILAGWTVKDTSDKAKQLTEQEKINQEALANIGTTLINMNQRIEARPNVTLIGADASGPPLLWLAKSKKADLCRYNVDGICRVISLPVEPIDNQLRGLTRKLEDGNWHVKACAQVCTLCELFDPRQTPQQAEQD